MRDVAALYHRSATFVDKILKGTPPAELPIERAVKFDLVVNLKTAKALGLEVPLNRPRHVLTVRGIVLSVRAIARVDCPSLASETIRARKTSRCSVVGARGNHPNVES